jgi:3-methyl-2-oxobutanoate hydroxymethyltransferase
MTEAAERSKVTIPQLQAMKREGRKISMITAYDYPTGLLVDQAGIDIVLVGDSLGMTMLGYDTTVPVTMEEMIHHAKAVTRGCKNPFVIGDMPFMAYQTSFEDAIRNAGRFMKEANCDGIKLEGGVQMADTVRAIVRAGVPTMGHLGLTPQTISALGGFKVQGKDVTVAKRIVEDALALEEAGAFAILLEAIPTKLAALITEKCQIPIISIGAGPACDGQVLIFHDMFGLFQKFTPKFAKRYADVGETIREGVKQYIEEVRNGQFPEAKHSFTMPEEQYRQVREAFE